MPKNLEPTPETLAALEALPDEGPVVMLNLLKFEPAAFTPEVVMAAMGHAFFSLSLGGTFMVVYGSYLGAREPLVGNAVWTALADLGAGLLAGLAIIPAVLAFGHEPGSGPPEGNHGQ